MQTTTTGFTRRHVLASLPAMRAVCSLGWARERPGGQQNADSGEDQWFDRPMRWAQLTLVENDPGRFDLQEWLDYFKRVHADAACLSAGGCVAYYPTRIPLHHRSAWLEDQDPFGDLVAGCRKLGMIVVARTDPHAVHQEVHDTHPDWIAVDATGQKRRHWASPEMWVTCALGPYNFEFMTGVTREIVSLYRVDGVFSNRWSGSGMCYCRHCRENFRTYCGMDLPHTSNPHDPARRNYILWREQRLFELWSLWDAGIRKINPAASFIPNTGGGALSELDMKRAGEKAGMMVADRQARRGLMPPWANGKNAKEYRATLGRKPVVGIFSVGLVATFETSLYDEWGVRRPDFGLGDLFGARFAGRVEGPMQNSYLRIEKDSSSGLCHPVLKDLEDAGRIINGVYRVDATPLQKLPSVPLTLIPSYPDLPMEKVYPRVPRTEVPGVFLQEKGRGRVVYFPWDIDRTFWEVLCVDHGRLLRNAVDWASNEDRPVTVAGPGVLDVTVWKQQSSMTVHLVNLTNPMMMKGPFREFIPVGEQRVRVRLPAGKTASKVQLLVSGQKPGSRETGGYLEVLVPSILAHEVVAIDL